MIAPPTESPIPSLAISGSTGNERTLFIMLPGRGDRASAFIDAGFDAAARARGFDAVAMDAHLGYYLERSLIAQLHNEVVKPAREAGYRKVWFVGTSMGGLGSLLYASAHPDEVAGVILLAPYLGSGRSIRTVLSEGPLDRWNGEAEGLEDYELEIWRWLKRATGDENPTPVILGYGKSDRMAGGYEKLVDVVDFTAVYARDGGHKWTTWRPLWDSIVADLEL